MGFVFACGYCEMPLKDPADPSLDSIFKCPSCGQAETSENVKVVVAGFLQKGARIKLEEMLQAAASHGESLAHNDASRLKGVFRFIALEAHV